MKYCLFDGGDVVGPFTAKQLLLRAGFDAHSLVCPEEHSDEESYWKEAHFYEEFGFDPLQAPQPQAQEQAVSAAQSEQFLKEMDTAVEELSSFNVGEKGPVLSAPAPEVKETPAPAQKKPAAKAKTAQADLFAAAPPLNPASAAPHVKAESSVPPAQADSTAAPAQPGAPSGSSAPEKSAAPAEPTQVPPAAQKSGEQAASEFGRKISSILMQASKDMKRQDAASAQGEGSSAPEVVSSVPPPASVLKLHPQKPQPVQEETRTDKEEAPDAEPKTERSVNPALQLEPEVEVVARTISKVSPIEEYFNTIKSGDLGNILGIPDPKENSDMSLARALESQFEKTEPGEKRPLDEDPFDEFTPKTKSEEVDESLFAATPAEADKKTEEKLKRTLPDLKEAPALPLAGQEPASLPLAAEEDTLPPAMQELVVPEQEDDPNDRTVKTILEGTLKVDAPRGEIPEPIKKVPAKEGKPSRAARREEDAQDDLFKERVVQGRSGGMMKFIFLALGVVLLLVGFYLNLTQAEHPAEPQPAPAQTQAPAPAAKETLSAREAINALPPAPAKDPLELAKEIVQNHQLDKGRGTVEEYLAKRYASELSSGYAAMWSAEPLHRDVYVVKYRLAKTRKEPIVYIFQADTAKKKLTGALNNITLDLVGKIR